MRAIKSIVVTLGFALLTVLPAQCRSLDIYWIDVEGGAATLIVSPSGQSLLVDTGNPGADDRDAKRIYQVATKEAGLTKIDYLSTSHYHSDHVGGLEALVKLIPIEHFLDHGDSIETGQPATQLWAAYQSVSKGKRLVMKVGDRIPLKGVSGIVVSSNGEVLSKPLAGAGHNQFCDGAEQKAPDKSENGRSLGFLLTYGKFKFLDLGDLTWDREMALACPENKIGTVTLLQATHHGFYKDYSGAPALIRALQPEVVVVNNGAKKGLQPSAWENISQIPGLKSVWQEHLSVLSDKDHNTDDKKIANTQEADDGHWLKASIDSKGTFAITNSRNKYHEEYKAD
jgi:beta-lactamase superfamily II metal-dependent hydrolase